MKHLIYLVILIVLQSCITSVNNHNNYSSYQNEIVMIEGMNISATNIFGTLIISAGKGNIRYYTWDGDTRFVEMIPRKERWNGKFGIYYPGKGNHWNENHKITRGVLEESQINFDSTEDALEFLRHPSRIESTVYNDNGLVVTWSKSINPSGGSGSTLFVDVWQVLIKGNRPIELPGSQNEKIIVTIKK